MRVKGLCLAVAVLSFPGCQLAGDWGAGTRKVPIVSEVIVRLDRAHGGSVRLTEEERQILFSCLAGPSKKAFLRDNLCEDVWANWYELNGVVYRDKVYFVRYTRDDKRFEIITVTSEGDLAGACGGMRGFMGYTAIDRGPLATPSQPPVAEPVSCPSEFRGGPK
jgi:hypothetical protein